MMITGFLAHTAAKRRSMAEGLRRRGWLAGALLAGLAALAGCQSLPPVNNPASGASSHPVQIESASGPLSPRQSAAILGNLKRQSGSTEILDRHIRLVQSKVNSPLVIGNKVTLLQGDPQAQGAMLGVIRGARKSINLETYIFDDDRAGQEFASLLLAKREQGVRVNLIYDSVGSLTTPRQFFMNLKEHGVQIVEFNPANPVNPLFLKKGWRINNRDHRKLLVVDGKTAVTGSVNISGSYSSGPFLKSIQTSSGWGDTDIKIEGPVVAQFQQAFLETWTRQKGPPLDQHDFFPALKPAGHDIVLAIDSRSANPDRLIYVTLISAIKSAENYVHLTNAYFVPDPQLIEALESAARRGVDVKLILPSKSDSWLPLYAGRSHYEDLLEHGVKIFERRGAFLHSKTAVIDSVWSTVGSTNLDWRSFLHNDELNALILGRDFAGQMEDWFQTDLAGSVQIAQEKWRKRSPLSRIREWSARLWQYWL